jgi:hypothetical protein
VKGDVEVANHTGLSCIGSRGRPVRRAPMVQTTTSPAYDCGRTRAPGKCRGSTRRYGYGRRELLRGRCSERECARCDLTESPSARSREKSLDTSPGG